MMPQQTGATVLDAASAQNIDAYWRAANYLSVGQIYLCDNPLLNPARSPQHLAEIREWTWPG
ncbi:MAG: hypothetical protein M3N50_10265 [Pseudomonadota bacterium]|nr:hypothetical protein [Pseudomonadota bacterium]